MHNPIVPAVRVKVISKNRLQPFHFFELPKDIPEVSFITDEQANDYDWLVVHDDLPLVSNERASNAVITTDCPQSRTVLLTYEPSSVKYYGADYTRQFGMVLTSHDTDCLQHPNRYNVPPIGYWGYGDITAIRAHTSPPKKHYDISLFDSNKRERYTFHHHRFKFLNQLKSSLGKRLHIYGYGINPVVHKCEGLDDYRYSVVIENHLGRDHWTEKLSDCFLGFCLPFYVGCTNIEDYFPKASFIRIDITDPVAAITTISKTIANHEYEKRLPAICEARRRVLDKYNMGSVLARYIVGKDTTEKGHGIIYSRRAMIKRSLPNLCRYGLGKLRNRYRNYVINNSNG